MVVENQRRWDGWAVGKLDWKRCDFKCRRNVERVTQERTLAGRLFQMVGAAVRKPRVPNDKLHRVTDNRLDEADRKTAWGVPIHWAVALTLTFIDDSYRLQARTTQKKHPLYCFFLFRKSYSTETSGYYAWNRWWWYNAEKVVRLDRHVRISAVSPSRNRCVRVVRRRVPLPSSSIIW